MSIDTQEVLNNGSWTVKNRTVKIEIITPANRPQDWMIKLYRHITRTASVDSIEVKPEVIPVIAVNFLNKVAAKTFTINPGQETEKSLSGVELAQFLETASDDLFNEWYLEQNPPE